jgi:ubiquinone/menaquinone biosynthesis C-methylase UbiE
VASQAERATSFGAIAADYDRLRPSPADAAVEWLLPEQHDLAVDVAAGTGLLSRVMARQVKDVIAVELDHRMAAVLRERSPGVHVVQGRGEALPLADASADAVLISSAWHWLDPLRAVPEMARVLRPGGYLGLLRTGPERSWVNDLRQAREEDGSRRPPSQPGFPRTPLFGEVATGSFDSTRTMSVEDFVDLMATYSAVITASEDERAVILDRARAEVVQRFPGASHIDVPLRTRCWRVERVVAG